MNIDFFAEDVELPIFNEKDVISTLSTIIESSHKSLDYINFIFCSDNYILDINKQYLNHDYFTDIITFDYSEESISSDVYISIDRILDNSKNLNIPFNRELYRIIIHGALHLVGFKDKEPEQKIEMTNQEDKYLKYLS